MLANMFSKIPLTSLRSFESAARLSSFKAAAIELFVTPSAISHQVKSLEHWLGLLLFERVAKGVTLTTEGLDLYKNIHQHFSSINQSLSKLRSQTDENAITVTTTHAFASLWLIPRLGDFYRRHPTMQVNIITSKTQADLHRDASIDVAISSVFEEVPDTYQLHLMDESFQAYTPYRTPLSGETRSPLINVRWEADGHNPFDWTTWCQAAGHDDWLANATFMEYDDEHHALQAATSGYGMVLASDVLAVDSVTRGFLTPYKPEVKLTGTHYVSACVPGRERNPPVRDFLDWLSKEASKHLVLQRLLTESIDFSAHKNPLRNDRNQSMLKLQIY
ncbi:Regulatory protein, LysR:LysR, substrate-binding [Pseudomonas syringae]|nr:LysR family transcriptional regulator [Pseudomonas syringae]RMN69170.1 Regulatory protein, LysR:LysR, substrate-binding [Pseudomonas syringae]